MIRRLLFLSLVFLSLYNSGHAETVPAPDKEFDQILSMDISELTVTSVSKKEEKLSDAASAIYVITNEDIKRMGSTSIPEALRIVPGLQVAQFNSHGWTVSARGFNSGLNNKLLVLIDGRSVYTPVYAGVYWDDQIVMLEDVDRIEVIRGPGASLYGANAMNGVINIITKKSSETQGTYLAETLGTIEYHNTEARYGGKVDDDTFYRVYAKEFADGDTRIQGAGGQHNFDAWNRQQTGFRVDTEKKADDNFTFSGDIYTGNHDEFSQVQTTAAPFSILQSRVDEDSGGNILGRWTHRVSDSSNTSMQMYVDNYDRDEIIAKQNITSLDIDFQNNITVNDRNNFVWGAGFRYDVENLTGSSSLVFPNTNKNYDVLSAFLQNEYAIIPNQLFWTLGSKFEFNSFTGYEIEPSTRLAWKPASNQTLWGAVSRSVRVPSMIEENLDSLAQTVTVPGIPQPIAVHLLGNSSLNSEELISYELGYRIEPIKTVSLDNSVFFNHYDRLVNGQMGTPFSSGGVLDFPVIIANGGYGDTWGFETSANWHVTPVWQLTAGYSLVKLDLHVDNGTTSLDTTNEAAPQNQFSIRSYLDLPHNLQFDNTLYYVERIAMSGAADIPSYFRLDSRLAWKISPGVEASVIGRNLLEHSHAEYPETPITAMIDRSFLAKISYKF